MIFYNIYIPNYYLLFSPSIGIYSLSTICLFYYMYLLPM
jgi:hypothetical protein